MILYFIKCTIAMGASWFVYRIFLAEQKNFLLNRIYLLFSIVGSTLAPLITLPNCFEKLTITKSIYPFVGTNETLNVAMANSSTVTNSYNPSDFILWITLPVSVLLAVRLLNRIIKLIRLQLIPSTISKEGIRIVVIDDNRTPFSFFKTIYINPVSYINGIEEAILVHEKYHIKQWHTLDRILVEFISIFQWMNPFLYLLKRDLIDNHEYAADAYAIDQTQDALSYLSILLNNAASTSQHNFLVQQFAYSSSMRRIQMISKVKRNIKLWYKPLAYMLLAGILISCSDDIDISATSTNFSKSRSHTNSSIDLSAYRFHVKRMMDGEIPFPPEKAPETNKPRQFLFPNWINNKNITVFIDQHRVDNKLLIGKSAREFSLFTVREIIEKKGNLDAFEFRVDLMTNESYDKLKHERDRLRNEYKEKYPEVWFKLDLDHWGNNLKRSNFF